MTVRYGVCLTNECSYERVFGKKGGGLSTGCGQPLSVVSDYAEGLSPVNFLARSPARGGAYGTILGPTYSGKIYPISGLFRLFSMCRGSSFVFPDESYDAGRASSQASSYSIQPHMRTSRNSGGSAYAANSTSPFPT